VKRERGEGGDGFRQEGLNMKLWRRVGGWMIASLFGATLTCLGAEQGAVAAESGLRVDYDGSRLSVEARDVSLFALLTEVGAKVGFSVVETAPSSVTVTLSIRDATLDDALRQLLRAENHTVYYRVGSGGTSQARDGIDRIVLSGEPGAAGAVASSGPMPDRLQNDRPQAVGGDQASMSSPGPVTTPPAASLLQPDVLSRIASDLTAGPTGVEDPAAPPVNVGDLLKAHAMAAVPVASPAGLPATPTPASSAPAGLVSSPPPGLDASLAETTRRAQQALGALVGALATATRSMQKSGSPAAGSP
jgi:hypothetical protein